MYELSITCSIWENLKGKNSGAW